MPRRLWIALPATAALLISGCGSSNDSSSTSATSLPSTATTASTTATTATKLPKTCSTNATGTVTVLSKAADTGKIKIPQYGTVTFKPSTDIAQKGKAVKKGDKVYATVTKKQATCVLLVSPK